MLPVIERRNEEATKRRLYYNQGAHGLKPLGINDKVVVQHEETKRWDRKGIIIQKGPHRKYCIKLENGRSIWRNRRFVKLNHEIEIQHHPKAERKHVQFKEERGRRRSERIKQKELKKT